MMEEKDNASQGLESPMSQETNNNGYQTDQSRNYRYTQMQEKCEDTPLPFSNQSRCNDVGDNIPMKTGKKKVKKEKKSITTKTFAHGMMDVSLLTSNATQLRAVLSNPGYEFFTLLLWLIGLSIVLQILSAVLLITSDFYKTQVKEIDRQNQRKRKFLSFLSLTLVTIVMSLNILISAFSTPSYPSHQLPQKQENIEIPTFSSSGNRSEL